jgi:hypothetical protein
VADIEVAQADFGYTLTFTVNTASGAAFDLTGKTVTMKVWQPTKPSVVIVNGSCTITGATTGVCTYNPISTDFLAVGDYRVELEMTEVGKQDSTKAYSLRVSESA